MTNINLFTFNYCFLYTKPSHSPIKISRYGLFLFLLCSIHTIIIKLSKMKVSGMRRLCSKSNIYQYIQIYVQTMEVDHTENQGKIQQQSMEVDQTENRGTYRRSSPTSPRTGKRSRKKPSCTSRVRTTRTSERRTTAPTSTVKFVLKQRRGRGTT